MLDIKEIRKDPKGIETRLRTKEPALTLSSVLELDERVRRILTEAEELQATRNQLSKDIGERRRKGEESASQLIEVSGMGERIAALEQELSGLKEKLQEALSSLPNLPDESVKISLNKEDNVCLKSVGERPSFSFPIRSHLELGEGLALFDFERGAKLAGSGWPLYRGRGARLEWALLNYMLDIHEENGFEQWMVPLLVKKEILYGSGQLPKFADQSFKLDDAHFPFYLIPTAEVVLNGVHFDEILNADDLPLKYAAYTPCFRREAGAAGRQERGLIRTHQFNKVEMFAFSAPETSEELFREMIASAEKILSGLNLHYRLMQLVTADTSFAATKTVDVEVWLPSQERYYEVSSISHCSDFQARRSKIRFRKRGGKPELVHTLNGSGLATSRLMIALLESNQRPDGSVSLPLVLHHYLKGMKELNIR
ncbi:MAG: serine--tRNA ligase [Chlamydiae bacterium GWC2_50_10]|nr:MAG: serine--tRNA ligase [Chlamydiae bacterium GWA2_50_15]OGN54809.1 MAG: serine--tRNA ligase [Chlamydiae bacterium GWC2_50_10]OGN54891.1 MAG: serine--tRNA ligase [Chlamydiae bacterium GWF2_49_8]OGN58633.1 MAG: serine--tRNA ligase [Chlamydiae bacterium RIFCSPHIGHO2_02_FULL_49_29]OGN63841.1 MAG: serine--tRNA ligase [Chlamydiae bacterium RIFCSPHIGHO2_12_FULL_49_32]OGN70273.1 MAG: serine--tRNA ligase [Chlamydiae bacterium RIFCSPLOWO2_02_FULL_49_12]OGN72687.1 MAG: serine--tRNA ligase [Chlamydi